MNDTGTLSLVANPDWAQLSLFDRSGWQTVRFGDVVECVNETCDPAEAGIKRFIGMEHLEPGSLHVREWGNVADGTTFTRRCRPGQVLFGKRRAYQRKVAVAEFDAVVSGDIYVFAPKGDRLLPELLPFICMSERFFQFAVDTSAGSLSPRTNWRHLAQFEFALPPVAEQRRIAEILWAVDSVVGEYVRVAASARSAVSSLRQGHFTEGQDLYTLRKLSEVGRWYSGKTPSRDRNNFWNGDFPWVSPKDMKTSVILDAEEHLSPEGRNAAVEVDANCILMVVRGMILAHSVPIAITGRRVAFNQDMKALVPDSLCSVEYIYNWAKWATPMILGRTSDSSHGTKRIPMDDVLGMVMPIPPRTVQEQFVGQIKAVQELESRVQESLAALVSLRSALLNTLLGG